MYLTIDSGNTLIKAAIFSSNGNIQKIFLDTDERKLHPFIADHTIDSAIISNVTERDFTFLSGYIHHIVTLSSHTPIPIVNEYATPATLGMDRLAAACGAAYLSPRRNNMIIDAGTCIKCDIVTQNNIYKGGCISPGITMRYKALHDYTAKLPLLQPDQGAFRLIGDSTDLSIHSGALWGAVMEVQMRIQEMNAQYTDLQIFLTGGDTNIFENTLKGGIFAERYLSLIGLYYILKHNVT